MLLRLLFFTLFLSAMSVFPQTPTIDAGVPQTLARWRAGNYSDVRYKLNLTLEKMSPVLKGTIEISLKNNADQIVLDWRKLRGKEDLSRVENVFVNGKAAKYEEINEHLVFKDSVIKGENVVKLDFTSPILTSGGAITRYVDKEDNAEYVYSLFVPSDASTAFPAFDQPDLKARFQLDLTFPIQWKSVSNAVVKLMERPKCANLEKCLQSYSFAETKPISTYVFAFAAGDFAEFENTIKLHPTLSNEANKPNVSPVKNDGSTMPLKIYVRKSQAEKFKQHATETFRLNREAVKYLESYFDYKFPFQKYDLVLIPEFPFGGMEHAGATFLREDRIIFPTEPTKNDFVTRANLIFHEAAHQWFGDTVTMRWFDDLWLKEGFAEFMAYKTLERVMPEYNSWKIFYERNKQLAYLTDSTKGTTPIYQEISNLASAKSAYGNIVYRKAPSFLKQAEFYLGEDKFQTAVREFLKKHEFANAEWTDLVKEFEKASGQNLKEWANVWVKKAGLPIITPALELFDSNEKTNAFTVHHHTIYPKNFLPQIGESNYWNQDVKVLRVFRDESREETTAFLGATNMHSFTAKYKELFENVNKITENKITENNKSKQVQFVFPNYQDYGYGIFLLDAKSRDYVLKNIQNEQNDFLRTMMWGSLWDSVREAELAPQDYVELVIKNINVETDESTIQTLLGRVATAMNYYLSDRQRETFAPKVETVLFGRMRDAKTLGQRITFFRAYLNVASTENAQSLLKKILKSDGKPIEFEDESLPGVIRLGEILQKRAIPLSKIPPLEVPPLKTKDKFDIVTRLLILENKRIIGNNEAEKLLAELEKTETSDEAKRYAYAARAGIGTDKNKAKFFDDFTNNKELSESWIESAFVAFNSPRHSELTLPFLDKALTELPNLKRNRKIFFVNSWLAAFIGGQRSEQALQVVNKFLADNPSLDKDLRLKVLEVSDGLERSVKIRRKFTVL